MTDRQLKAFFIAAIVVNLVIVGFAFWATVLR